MVIGHSSLRSRWHTSCSPSADHEGVIMKKKTQPKKQKEDQKKEKLQEKQLVTLDDVELKHVTGGLAFCTTPWD